MDVGVGDNGMTSYERDAAHALDQTYPRAVRSEAKDARMVEENPPQKC